MLDHVLGRPSAGFKRIQVLLFTLAAFSVIRRKDSSYPTPKLFKWIDKKLAAYSPWKIVFGVLSATYLINNLFLLLYLNAPEPLARMYTRNFYRATYVLTALDAGCLTAMGMRPRWLREILSFVFGVFYLFRPDAADTKVRKYRALASVEMMRTSWEGRILNPVVRLITFTERGFLPIRRDINIARPTPPSITSFPERELGPVRARLYFAGTEEEMRKSKELILQLPGGGFVTMNPKCHDDYVSNWARQTKKPIVALDYGKAPEYPYPFGLEECFDAYRSIVESNGSVIGLQGWEKDERGNDIIKDPIKIVMCGDSAGGNLAVGVVMRCLETHEKVIAPPAGLILIYPCLSFDIACWMPPDQLKLIRAESQRSLSITNFIEAKQRIKQLSPLAQPEAPRKINVLSGTADRSKSWYHNFRSQPPPAGPTIPSNLSMTSRMSYFTDRIIQPEMMRAMALLYLGSSPEPADLGSDYYLSPVIAPDELLARFPKTYFICGEKDPFVDDTVVLAGRLRDIKKKAHREWQRTMKRYPPPDSASSPASDSIIDGQPATSHRPRHLSIPHNPSVDIATAHQILNNHIFSRDPDAMVRVNILEGISHAFFNMAAILPEAKQATRLTSNWFLEMFADEDAGKNLGCCPDTAEELTDTMIQQISGKTDDTLLRSPSAYGPFYPIYGAPMHMPSPHILVDGVSPEQAFDFAPVGYGAEGDAELDVVKEKHLLERRRLELGSTLYHRDG